MSNNEMKNIEFFFILFMKIIYEFKILAFRFFFFFT